LLGLDSPLALLTEDALIVSICGCALSGFPQDTNKARKNPAAIPPMAAGIFWRTNLSCDRPIAAEYHFQERIGTMRL
jgi:hypothetical protein